MTDTGLIIGLISAFGFLALAALLTPIVLKRRGGGKGGGAEEDGQGNDDCEEQRPAGRGKVTHMDAPVSREVGGFGADGDAAEAKGQESHEGRLREFIGSLNALPEPADGEEQVVTTADPQRSGSCWKSGLSPRLSCLMDDVEREPVFPFLLQDQTVEYYSRTHRCWLPGDLTVRVGRPGPWEAPRVSYSMRVNTGGRLQDRHMVPLDCMRLRLEEGELVEMFCKNRELWLPAVVEGEQGIWSGNGIRIRLLTPEGLDGEMTARMPSNFLRRRYLPGTRVQRYAGPTAGWVPGVVADPGTLDLEALRQSEAATPEEPVFSLTSLASLTSLGGAPQVPLGSGGSTASTGSTGSESSPGGSSPAGQPGEALVDLSGSGGLLPWTLVPVRDEGAQDAALVRSHLIRCANGIARL